MRSNSVVLSIVKCRSPILSSMSDCRLASKPCPITNRKSAKQSSISNRQSPIPGGFTLVELLVVVAILGILASLVTAGAQAARRRGAMTKAKSTIAALETAIAMYEGDLGEYPSMGNAGLISALQDDPNDADWNGPYMEFKEEELKDGQLLDPWGQAYSYVSVNGGSPQHRERSFDLWSFGPNREDDGGTGDDIYNW